MKYGNMVPRYYQAEAHQATVEHIRQYTGPVFINATVGAGKSLLIAMVCHRAQEVNWRVLVLSRQSEIIEQNAQEAWECGVKNSIFSASAGVKSTAYPIIFGTEGTVARALDSDLADFVPNLLLIDECVTGDTMIETSQGMVRIDNPNLEHMKIKCVSEDDGSISYHKPVRVFTNGIKHVSSIELSSGEVLRCTDTHKIYCKGSWVRSSYLKNGDELTLSDSQSGVMKRLLRASAAVARRLAQVIKGERL